MFVSMPLTYKHALSSVKEVDELIFLFLLDKYTRKIFGYLLFPAE
jgi:hypothetical protein